MTENRDKEEQVARTAQLREILSTTTLGSDEDELRLVVAEDAETLARWGKQMVNAIGLYANQIGLATMFAVVDDQGAVLVNGHIAEDRLTMLHAKCNKPAKTALSQEHLNQLMGTFATLGIDTAHTAGVG